MNAEINTDSTERFNIFESKKFRHLLSRYLLTDFEQDGYEGQHDIRLAFEKMKQIEDAINRNDDVIVLEGMNVFAETKDIVANVFETYGIWKWNENLSDTENYKWVYVKVEREVDYSNDDVLMVIAEVSILACHMNSRRQIRIPYTDELVEWLKPLMSDFLVFNELKFKENEGHEFGDNVDKFFSKFLLEEFKEN